MSRGKPSTRPKRTGRGSRTAHRAPAAPPQRAPDVGVTARVTASQPLKKLSSFAGLARVLEDTPILDLEVDDDLDGEQETYENDRWVAEPSLDLSDQNDPEALCSVAYAHMLDDVSHGLSENTVKDYKR